MIESATEASTEGCEQKNDVDVVDSRMGPSAVAAAIDFPAVFTSANATDGLPVVHEQAKEETEPISCTKCPNLTAEVASLRNAATENELLRAALTKVNGQFMQVQTVLAQRDSMVELQQKELTLLENEKLSIKREYETAKREKETAVVRYAMVEKTIIDLNTAKDLIARKLKDSTKEVELLSNRLKVVSGERDKALKEHRDSIRECESLKTELQMYESKNKYNQVRIKQEVTAKNALEVKLGEITQQLSQLTDERQNRMDSERKSEQEQGAQVIMLKHMAEEKEKEIAAVQKKLTALTTEFDELSDKYNVLVVDHEYEKIERSRLQDKVAELEDIIQQRNACQDDLKCRLGDCEMKCETLTRENEVLTASLNQLKETEVDFNDQSEEMFNVRAREDELLSLLKDITEKCVVVENQLILSNTKTSTLSLENEKIKKEFEAQNSVIKTLDEQLVTAKLKRADEARVFGRLLTEQKSNCVRLKIELENAQGELVTQKRKHAQVVKELTRELVTLRSSNESSPKSTKSSRGGGKSDSDAANQNQSPCIHGKNEVIDSDTGPTKKALIDKIARLQVIVAKQTEKIEFLENHCIALTNELRTKSS